jgi:hypothetical protein
VVVGYVQGVFAEAMLALFTELFAFGTALTTIAIADKTIIKEIATAITVLFLFLSIKDFTSYFVTSID